jgi:hypothetical protein
MPNLIPLYLCRLSRGRSIGPSALRKLWSIACGSDDVRVRRVATETPGDELDCLYSFSGPSSKANSPLVEARLRQLLTEMSPTAAIRLTSLG